MRRKWPAHNIEVENTDEGLLVRQDGEAYVARNWRLTPATEQLISAAIASGLCCMIREDHPRKNARWPNTRGVVYLAFSPNSKCQWAFAIDTFRAGRGTYGAAVFNGKYQAQFSAAGLPFSFERRNKGAGHLVVAQENVIPTIEALAGFDHQVLALNRSHHGGEGFSTEYVLQRQILTNWNRTPFAERYDIIQDEFPVDGGLTSRRIDILARDRLSGDWLVIELKRAEANTPAVAQVADYVLALGRRDDFATGILRAVLIAERFSPEVRRAAERECVDLYEARWPANLSRVA